MSNKNDIQGNFNISRNVNVGSHATIGGDLSVGHNVRVKGWLDAPNIKGALKGLYASESALSEAYPQPQPGWFALVGSTLPAAVYRVEGGKWVATGESGGEFSVYLDTLEKSLSQETTERKDTDTNLQALITGLRTDFDSLVGENASEAIDNFNEVLSFLDGLKDPEKLSTKLANLSSTDVKLSADVLELQEEVWPLIVDFRATPTIIKAGVETAISLTWNAKRKGKEITADAVITLDGNAIEGIGKAVNMVLSHGQSRTVTLKTEYAGMTDIRICAIKGTLPTYFGIVPKTWTANESNIQALSELIIGERTVTRTNIHINDEMIALSYPKNFGPLTSIKDGNGYEVLSSYTMSEVSVNGNDYLCYQLTVPVTASGVTQNYK